MRRSRSSGTGSQRTLRPPSDLSPCRNAPRTSPLQMWRCWWAARAKTMFRPLWEHVGEARSKEVRSGSWNPSTTNLPLSWPSDFRVMTHRIRMRGPVAEDRNARSTTSLTNHCSTSSAFAAASSSFSSGVRWRTLTSHRAGFFLAKSFACSAA